MNILQFPSQDTYFVISEQGKVSYGKITPTQKVESGLGELETFTVEQDWLDRLTELGIDNLEFIS
jgi:hypothetical protein